MLIGFADGHTEFFTDHNGFVKEFPRLPDVPKPADATP